MRLPLTLLLFVVVADCFGQEIKLSRLNNSIRLDSLMTMYYDNSRSNDFITVPFEAYSPPPQVPGSHWWFDGYFHIAIHNDTPKDFAVTIYTTAGKARVARVDTKGQLVKMIDALDYAGPWMFDEKYFPVTIPRDSTWHIVVRSENELVIQHVSAWLVDQSFTETFFEAYTSSFFGMTFFHCIVGGMLAMMFLYVFSQFIFFRTPEYGYYAAYIFIMLFFLFVNSWEEFQFDFISGTKNWYHWLNTGLQMVGYCLYFAFLIYYFNSKKTDRVLYRILQIAIVAQLAFLIFGTTWTAIFGHFALIWWTIFRLMLATLVAYLAYRVWNLKMPYARYPIYGGVIFMLFALGSLYVSLIRNEYEAYARSGWPFNYEMFYYFVGVVLEMIFFSLGLAYKRRQDAIEVERIQVQLLNTLSEVQETERSRFAKDLHDGLGGMLSGVKLSLSNMKGNVVLAGEHVDVFERALDMLDNSIHELRRVAHNLMPESLVKFGLAASLKDFCDFINSSKVITVIFQQIGTYKRLEISVEIVLYRIANELANNTLRHAAATELIIQLNYDDHSLTLTVEDNGKGFDQSVLERTTGSGWPNIKSRVAYLKGSLDVQTSAGNGTSVNITIPI